MILPLRAFFHPTNERLNLPRIERFALLRRRHEFVRIAAGQPLHQGAPFKIARHDGTIAGLQGLECVFPPVEA